MEARIKRAGIIALAALGMTLAAGAAMASDNHIVVAPGGPHPYFAPWEQAAADAQKDFGIALGRLQSAVRLEARAADRADRNRWPRRASTASASSRAIRWA